MTFVKTNCSHNDLKKEKESDKDEKKASEKVTLKKSKSASDDK